MQKWKSFFYFSKGDQIAILLLFVLILISGSIYLYIQKIEDTDLTYYAQQEALYKNFELFEQQLIKNKSSLINDEINTKTKKQQPVSRRQKKNKLTIGQVIDINDASTTALCQIPGIGITYAKKIIAYRDVLGGFYKLEQLLEIDGISINKFSTILPYLIIKKKHRVININNNIDLLKAHPYFNAQQINVIIEHLKSSSSLSIDDLRTEQIFTKSDLERIEPYL